MKMAVLPLNYLPVGFRFSPTDEELVNYYLRLKIIGEESKVKAIREVDVCRFEPWDLPELSEIKNEDPEWFFFCPRDQKYPKGKRSNRATYAGYWKATGKDRTIKSKSLGMKVIGMKKTLVFHKGRAPGGQRTSWIMHEYRMHQYGMISDEGPYVLCRLFNKDKAEDENCDEIEPTGSSPTTTYSSPIGMPPGQALVQENSESNMQGGEVSTGINRWLEDISNKANSTYLLPEQSYSNSCQASDVEDPGTEVRATEMDPQKGDYIGISNDATIEALDYQTLSPLHSTMYTEIGHSYMDFPYASDFSNTYNAIPFQDGSSEKDNFDPGLLEKVFSNQEYCDDSVSQKYSAFDSEPDAPSIFMIEEQSGESMFVKESGSCSDTDNEVLQAQAYRELEVSLQFNGLVDTNVSSQTQKALEFNKAEAFNGEELWTGNMDFLLSDPLILDSSSVGASTCLFHNPCNNHEENPSQMTHVYDSGNSVETGVKIRTREAQHSQKTVSQGNAPRRIRLQKHTRRTASFKGRESCTTAKDQEAKPIVAETAGEAIENATISVARIALSQASADDNEISQQPKTKLKLRSRWRRNNVSDRDDASLIEAARPLSYSSRYMVFVALIIILFVFFIAAWRCLAT